MKILRAHNVDENNLDATTAINRQDMIDFTAKAMSIAGRSSMMQVPMVFLMVQ